MCTNKHKVWNKYLQRHILVDCGSCPACQQAKANRRASQIRSEKKPGQMALFVHLTYLNECVPYVLRSDLNKKLDEIPVYRDFNREWTRCQDTGIRKRRRQYRLKYIRQRSPIDYLSCIDSDGVNYLKDIDVLQGLQDLQPTAKPRPTTLSTDGKIGICYYKDLQNFHKKLKQIIIRDYGLPGNSFSSYSTAEYGSNYLRPHFHLLLFFDKTYENIFREAVLKAWTFAYRWITKRKLEEAIDAAKYCSSYVNKPSDFPPVLGCHPFRAKFSHSKDFGVGLAAFKLDQVLQAVRTGDLRYVRTVFLDGTPNQCLVPYPSYVINRYFPKFKGFSRLSDSEIHQLARFSYLQPRVCEQDPFTENWNVIPSSLNDSENYRTLSRSMLAFSVTHSGLSWTIDDIHKITTNVLNRCFLMDMSPYDYFLLYTQAHRVYKSTLYRSLLEDKDIVSQWQSYDNIQEYFNGECRSDSLDDLMFQTPKDYCYEVNPNNFSQNIARTQLLENQFSKFIKQRSVNAVLQPEYV